MQTSPSDTRMDDMLRQYALLSLCHDHSRPEEVWFESLIRMWTIELRDNVLASLISTPGYRSRRKSPGSFPLDSDEEMNDHDDLEQEPGPPILVLPTELTLTPPPTGDDRPSTGRRRLIRRRPRWQFTLFKPRSPDDVLHTVIISNMTDGDLATGYIYVLQRPEDPEYLKIGYTTQHPDVRLDEIHQSCGPEYLRLYASDKIGAARRVEALVHADLHSVRYTEQYCKHSLTCTSRHSEWFKLDLEKAKLTIEYWAAWIRDLQPYDGGRLKPTYVKLMFSGYDLDSTDRVPLFVQDSDGKVWVDHNQVLKPASSSMASTPVQDRLTTTRSESSNTSPPLSGLLPSPSSPGSLDPGSGMSSATSVASVDSSPFNHPSTTELTTDTSPHRSHRRRYFGDARRLLFRPDPNSTGNSARQFSTDSIREPSLDREHSADSRTSVRTEHAYMPNRGSDRRDSPPRSTFETSNTATNDHGTPSPDVTRRRAIVPRRTVRLGRGAMLPTEGDALMDALHESDDPANSSRLSCALSRNGIDSEEDKLIGDAANEHEHEQEDEDENDDEEEQMDYESDSNELIKTSR